MACTFMINQACDNGEAPHTTPDIEQGIEFTIKSDNYTFFADHEKFHEANTRRAKDNYCEVPNEIKKLQRQDNLLSVSVLVPKGCEVAYEVIWNGLVAESFPVQITLFLKTMGDCGTNEEMESDQLVLDLDKIFEDVDMVNPNEAVFTVKDACSLLDIQCTGNCDISVSE